MTRTQEFAVFNPRELSGIGTLRSIQSFLVEAPHFEGGFATQVYCTILQHAAAPCNTLQHPATHTALYM